MIKPSDKIIRIFKDVDCNEGYKGERLTLGLAFEALEQMQDVYLVGLLGLTQYLKKKNISDGTTLVSYQGGWNGRTELENEIQILIKEYGENYNFTELYEGI